MKKSCLLGAVLLFAGSTTSLMAAQIVPLGGLQTTAIRMDISGDGQTLVGPFSAPNSSYWTSSLGFVDVSGKKFRAVSGDGTVFASSATLNGFQGFRYSSTTNTIEPLTPIFGVNTLGLRPDSLSYDGSVMGGTESRNGGTHAGVWDSDGMPTDLGRTANFDVEVSGDGLVVAHRDYSSGQLERNVHVYNEETFAWEWQTSQLGFGYVPTDISFDGSIIVGNLTHYDAFRWTDGIGIESIPTGIFSDVAANAVTGDGSTIGGAVLDGQGDIRAAIWNETDGWQLIEDLLNAQGVDTTNLFLQEVFAISDDGNYLGVTGLGAGSAIEGYWIDLSATAVPIPAAVWLFGSGLLGLIGIARRKAA